MTLPRRLVEVSDLGPGQHACCIFSTDQERDLAVGSYMAHGLQRGEKIVYIADGDTRGRVGKMLDAAGLKEPSDRWRHQVIELGSGDTYLAGGGFDPDRMIELLRREADRALAEGFKALRVTGEMTWALREAPAGGRLMEYEARLNQHLPHIPCLALCQYDRRHFPSDLLLDVLIAHPYVLIGDRLYQNHHYLAMSQGSGAKASEERLNHWLRVLSDFREERSSLLTALRANSVLSACNQVLVRATDETAFMGVICRILVETGGYCLAWVGFVEHDERRSVRPVAQAGFEEGYLDALDVTWADEPRGRGPTGTAIRTGRAVTCRHVVTDPRFAPWREEALKRGYASSIALPLKVKNLTLGALNVYADGPDAFDEEETALLAELADDLAFGIQAIRARQEREAAVEALKLSEERYRDLVENSGDLIMTHLLDGTLVSVNRAILSLLGYSKAEDLVGRNILEFLPGGSERGLADYRDALLSRGGAKGVLTVRTRAGEERVLEYNNTLRTEGVTQPVVRGMARDITQRHAAQRALHESEARYKSLFQRNLAGVFRSTVEGRLLDCNQAFASILGFDSTATMQDVSAERHFADMRDFADLVTGLKAHGNLTNLELRLKRLDGSLIWAIANIALLEDPVTGERLLEGTLIDITDRKAVEEDRQRLATAIEQAGEAVMLTDREGTIVYANPALERLTGFTLGELVGRNPRILKSGAMPVRFYAELWDTILSGRVWSGRITNQRKDGNQYTAHMTISPVTQGDGPVNGFVCTVRDLTQELELEERLQRSRQLETIGMIAGGVAHEVRNPLFAISSLCAALEKRANDPELRRELLRQMKERSDHLTALMKDLLSLGGTIRPERFAPCDLSRVVAESLARLEQSHPGASLSTVVRVDGEPVVVDGDFERLVQVFMNLLSNALFFMPAGEKVEVALRVSGGRAVATVADRGPGIPRPLLSKIFEPFRSERKGGTGLGLAIVQRIVEAHGGVVRAANNQPERGSTFTVTLPLQRS